MERVTDLPKGDRVAFIAPGKQDLSLGVDSTISLRAREDFGLRDYEDMTDPTAQNGPVLVSVEDQ